MGLICFICHVEIASVFPAKLMEHGQVHQEEINFTCNEPGCGGKELGLMLGVEAIKHYCDHLRFRSRVNGDLDEEEEEEEEEKFATEEEKEAYLRAEESLNPAGFPYADWLLEEGSTKPATSLDFSERPREFTPEESEKYDFLRYAVKHTLTNEAIKDLFKTKLIKERANVDHFPSPEALRNQAWRFFEESGLGVKDLAQGKYKEPVPFFSVLQSIRAWMLHPFLSQVIWETSERDSAPHLHDCFLRANSSSSSSSRNDEKFYGNMADGEEWLDVLTRTSHLWYHRYIQQITKGKKVVVVHVLLFGDGIPLWRYRQQSFEVVTSTLGEFSEGLRSSNNSPATQVNIMASKVIIRDFLHGYDGVIRLFKPDFDALMEGVEFWCAHLNTQVTVFGVFHGFEGDLLGRCKAGGMKNPSKHTNAECSCCPGSKGKLAEMIKNHKFPEERDGTTLLQLIESIMGQKNVQVKEALMYQHGITRRSALWDFPGAQLNKQLLLDLMHCEIEGEIDKHFLKLAAKLETTHTDFWAKLDKSVKDYFLLQQLTFPPLNSINQWKNHLNAADRLKFTLHSIYLLKPFITPALANDFAAWKLHVFFIKLLVQHKMEIEDLELIKELPYHIQLMLMELYSEKILTPNSHWTFHFEYFIKLYSILRLYWTFPLESLLHKLKNGTKKVTNHKSVSWACMRIFALERNLQLFLDPFEDIPIQNGVQDNRGKIQVGHLQPSFQVFGIILNESDLIENNLIVTKNYQNFQPGQVCKTTEGYRKLLDIFRVGSQIFLHTLELEVAGNEDGQAILKPIEIRRLELEQLEFRCYGIWRIDGFLVVHMDK